MATTGMRELSLDRDDPAEEVSQQCVDAPRKPPGAAQPLAAVPDAAGHNHAGANKRPTSVQSAPSVHRSRHASANSFSAAAKPSRRHTDSSTAATGSTSTVVATTSSSASASSHASSRAAAKRHRPRTAAYHTHARSSSSSADSRRSYNSSAASEEAAAAAAVHLTGLSPQNSHRPGSAGVQLQQQQFQQLLQLQQVQQLQQQQQQKRRLNRAHTATQDARTLHENSRRLFPATNGTAGRTGRGLRRSMSEGVAAGTTMPADGTFWGAVAQAQAQQAEAEAEAGAEAAMEAEENQEEEEEEEDEEEEVTETALTVATVARPTVTHWTSEERRRREYAAIDRRSRGLRGLWNRLLPRFARSATKSRFYDQEKDGSDAGSVRRHRLALDGERR